MVTSLQTLTRVECGFASIENVLTKERADIMDSFFLAETLKYLWLLFSPDNQVCAYIHTYLYYVHKWFWDILHVQMFPRCSSTQSS